MFHQINSGKYRRGFAVADRSETCPYGFHDEGIPHATPLRLLPFNGGRRFAGDVIGHAVDAAYFIDDAPTHPRQ